MAVVTITGEARDDLFDIWDYIAEDSLSRADSFVHTLNDKFQMIAKNPDMGRERNDLPFDDLRSWAYRAYIIFYQPRIGGAEVVRVFHAARKYEDLL